MASSLAAQLSQIAAKSTNQLDLKAQRIAHSQSLIFEKKIAGSQDFDTIYHICHEGFQELCLLDARFAEFGRTIFSEQSKSQERTEMTAAQNKELDAVLEAFLALVGSKLLLSPAIKAVDWLVRRFRVHEYNTSSLIITFLPYHTAPIFLNLLVILPENLGPAFKVLAPYRRSQLNPPRHPLVHSAKTNPSFFNAINTYVLQASRQGAGHHGLLAFWAGIITEAVAGMLDATKSGRKEVERQKHEDILLRVLPVLNDGLSIREAPELIIGCYMLCVVLAQNSTLSDTTLNGLMEAVVESWNQDTLGSGLICLSVLAQKKNDATLPRRVVKAILRIENGVNKLAEITTPYPTSQLLLGIISKCVEGLDKQRDASRLDFVYSIFEHELLKGDTASTALGMILQAASDAVKTGGIQLEIESRFSDLIERVKESQSLRPLLEGAIEKSSVDIPQLQLQMQTLIQDELPPAPDGDVDMQDADKPEEAGSFEKAIESLATEKPTGSSFLGRQPADLFDGLVQLFASTVGSTEKLDKFTSLPVLGRSDATRKPSFLTFFVRVLSGPYPIGTRVAALKAVESFLSSATASECDFQVLLPYFIAALADHSERIRRETANALTALSSIYKKGKKNDSDEQKPWAHDTFYASEGRSNDIKWLSSSDVRKVMDRVLLPGLEEYSLDPSHISRVLESALKGLSVPDSSSSTGSAELKKSLRLSLFTFLCSHIVRTPLFTIKLRLLKVINRVDKAGGTTRTKELMPLLEAWRKLGQDEIHAICGKEHISASELESEVIAVVTPKDKEAIDILLTNVSGNPQSLRESFVTAVFNRIRDVWASVSEERQLDASEKLLDISLGISDAFSSMESYSREVLRSVHLPGPALLRFLDKIPASITDIESNAPASKRRRTSQNNMVAMSVRDEAELNRLMDKMTFILELVDNSAPENHPELADGLFQTLASLHLLKSQVQSGLSYLLSLALGSLLNIVNKAKVSKSAFDTSVIRADLVIDCVRTTESPQVQNTALLLVAGLSVVAPELVLHSVMPIFTFMGSSVLRKDDEYSVSVIDQTIDQVVPALIQSLRNQKRDVVSGTSELLLSFTAAFEHIPSHRRLRLFQALITKLGTQDFLFAVLAMLANRYAMNKDVLSLMAGLTSTTDSRLQLITYAKYLDLVSDSLKPKPGISQVLLGVGGEDGRDPQKVAVDLLRALAHLLKHSSLQPKMSETFNSGNEKLSAEVQTLFAHILERVLTIGEAVQTMKPVSLACGDVLGSLLGTLSLVDFLDTIEALLQRPNDELRRKVLRLLEARLRQTPERESVCQNRTLQFLSVLVHIIESSPDILLKHAAVACIDRISDIYGKKDPSKVVHAAKVVASERCIGETDDRIRVMGILCLASMAEVLGEAIIPALPEALARSFSLLEISLERGNINPKLHDAVFSLISALFIQVPFMISGDHLDNILRLSFKSAASDLHEESDESRRESLRLLARKVDVKESFGAVERNWSVAVAAGSTAANEALEVVSTAIEKHPKAATVKNVNSLVNLLQKALDLRREQLVAGSASRYDIQDLEEVEETVNEVAIKMIYKLNDTTFRPLFVKLTEWATSGLPKKDSLGRTMRLTTFYKFLQHFFGTLKSIVTGYASYVIDNTVEVLGKANPTDKNSKDLWLATVRMLRHAFEHDQDEFWQSPSHLTAISGPLISQLAHATSASTAAIVISEAVPAITELAVAADSPDNHKELNASIMKFLRPSASGTSKAAAGENPHTRVAALKVERSLTERLGEEWLALLPEMLPFISELMEDEDEAVEKEVRRWVLEIEDVLGEKLDDMLM
ncbi:U3 small nucleolar RNA-associated protein 10 [Paecilomyces variotii]|uniref:U3 small nucleolar RNA-associated protein 10 n=1 Tax=Byssochlamys spectabilis TaxID=264951 RepID=A0A443HLC4_BYSSP|nr:U3 small nucleolar RNA-associated protein 10 [Paecilomyces variotii]KAJ9229994.1 hypothetical protein DTO169E5_8633 [Paecilomyces variotii]KAJ9359068.1 hypothetical protein DTO280E4_4931 [Paecilomyces variotii]KAJ9372775.1 hypothetical protein DTO282E5_2502 [Paecilomyces variotii]RWQ92592.1 U3 small nucleolar RNA-associated protein 10 [Paecilomyces variotii]